MTIYFLLPFFSDLQNFIF